MTERVVNNAQKRVASHTRKPVNRSSTHIRPWSVSRDNSDSNLITVCYDCHAKLHANDNWKLMVDAQKCRRLEDFTWR